MRLDLDQNVLDPKNGDFRTKQSFIVLSECQNGHKRMQMEKTTFNKKDENHCFYAKVSTISK